MDSPHIENRHMKNDYDALYKIPYSRGSSIIGRYDRLQVVQVFNVDYTDTFSVDELDANKELFTCLVDFKNCRWESIGESKKLSLKEICFYMVGSSRIIEEKIYSDMETFQIYKKELVDDKVQISFSDSDLDSCVGMDRFSVYSEENIVSRILFERKGMDDHQRGEDYYSTLGPLERDAWFLKTPI